MADRAEQRDPAVFARRYRYRAVAKSVLKPEAWPLWLCEKLADAPQFKALLAPYPSEDIICWPVSARVGNVFLPCVAASASPPT